MFENGTYRRSFFAGLLAIFLLGVFILVNYYRFYRDSHQIIDPFKGIEREKLPAVLEGKGKLLVLHDFESGNAADTASQLAAIGHGGKQSLKMSSRVIFSPGLWIKFKDLNPGDSSWIRASGYVWFSCSPAEVNCRLVATCNHKGVNYKYLFTPFETENLKPNQWNRVSIDYHILPAPDREDVLQAYFWYRGNGVLLLDDVEIQLFEPAKH